MNFIFDYLMTDGQRERLEKTEKRAALAIKKEYEAMKAAAAVYLDETGDELQALIKAAEEAEKDPKSEYRKHAAKLAAMEEKRDKTRFALYGEFMAEYLATVGTDPAAILADFSDRVKLFIDASEETDPEAIRAAITAELLPYYAEALANTGTENAVTQLHNIIIAQLHNAAELPAKPSDVELKPRPKLESLAIMRDRAIDAIVQASGPKPPPEYIGLKEEANGQLKMAFMVKRQDNAADVTTYITLGTNDTATATAERLGLTAFDFNILDIIATRYRQHKNTPAGRIGDHFYIYPVHIWADLNGKAGRVKPRESQLQPIIESLERMRKTSLYLNFSDEVNAGHMNRGVFVSDFDVDALVLQAERIRARLSNGAHVDAYQVLTEPAIYKYTAAKNNVVMLDYKYMDISGAVEAASDPETVNLKLYLAREVLAMADGKRKFFNMRYDTIFKATGTDPAAGTSPENHKTEKSYRDAVAKRERILKKRVCEILAFYAENGLIKSYEEYPEAGKNATGVKVKLTAKEA